MILIADLMNDFFSSISGKLSKNIPNTENDLLNGDYDINLTKNHLFVYTYRIWTRYHSNE